MLTNYALPAGVRVAGAVAVVLLAASPVWSQTSASQDAGAQATEQQVVAAGRSGHRRGAPSPGRAGPPRRASRRSRRADGLLCRPHRRAALGNRQRPQHARAGCHRRNPQGRGLGPCARRLRAAAPGRGRRLARRARRCRDHGRPGRAGIRAPCPRRTPRPVLAQRQLRCKAARPRSQARAGGRVRPPTRSARIWSACIPGTSSSRSCARRSSKFAAASASRSPSRRCW